MMTVSTYQPRRVSQCPIQAITVAFNFYVASTFAFEPFVETVDIPLQTRVTDKKTWCVGTDLREVCELYQVVTHLETTELAVSGVASRYRPGSDQGSCHRLGPSQLPNAPVSVSSR